MADDLEDDQWLYGDNPESSDVNSGEPPTNTENEEKTEEGEVPSKPSEEQPEPTLQAVEDDGPPGVDIDEKENGLETHDGIEDGEVQQNGDSEKEDLDDDSDDDVNVVIGDIKPTAPSYTSLNIKRGGLLTSVGDKNKQAPQQQPGKFVVEEFEQIGTINGVPAMEFNVDSLEDKPWRKPGADITDYFNYGFNEDTWRAYCERQKRMRVNESGVGLIPMNNIGLARGPIPIMNDNSKYAGSFIGAVQRTMPPPIMKVDQVPKVNTIQVMTADRREYSRKPAGFPDMTVPPPATFENFQPEYGFNPEPEPFYGGYEPTQDSQWGTEPPPGWVPTDLKTLTGPPPMGPPPMHMGPPPAMRSPSSRRDNSPHKERDRDRERESRSRSEKPRDRDRERSHRRERSRSRSRRHKSRSRSPSHRSHRKKKSRRHEDSD
ncbi:factor interacting with poly(A) polymerase 1 isoform X2 [Leptinotarsa decemlineata]|uniref:factor interacting with poly(A) polymerase 1 isoform X2 n=1 Tax=Leptinotarsa decemlineata TaxID=7539 RepID=UPI000C253593|nr:pre-mRNA 3'-end-processing factor FIP1 isoform X2 [Leptinotarsa decemlineata]